MRRLALLAGLVVACSDGPTAPAGTAKLQLVTAALTNPVFLTAPPGDTNRLFVVEQGGTIRIIRHDTLLATPFLDISSKVVSGGEQGLLSMAFHPLYATNKRFYVYFTDLNGNIRIVRYLVSTDSNVADATSGDTVLAVAHPSQTNHNGGQLQFGPDGMLYAGLGDGGGGGDPYLNGQNKHTLLGKLLRVDVSGTTGYTIPPNNPFVGDTSAAPEVWAWGLRNPWRFSFDRQTNDLYIADVGQDLWEEVDVAPGGVPGGLNYGWNIMEGDHCYNASTCNMTGLWLPVLEYGHTNGACAIVGGYAYRGSAVRALAGRYLYSDNCAGFVKSFRYVAGFATEQYDWSAQLSGLSGVSSFGQDARGELYVVTLGGAVYRIVAGP
jgi:glucose/arabinose dehydrogenase